VAAPPGCVEWSGGGAVEVVAALHASCPRACSLKKKGGAPPAPGISHSTHHAASATAAHLASAELGVARMAWGQKAAGGSGARVAWGEVMKASENDAKQRGRGVAERDAPVSRLDRRKKGEVPSRVRGCRNGKKLGGRRAHRARRAPPSWRPGIGPSFVPAWEGAAARLIRSARGVVLGSSVPFGSWSAARLS
jgi:hypothetical protein